MQNPENVTPFPSDISICVQYLWNTSVATYIFNCIYARINKFYKIMTVPLANKKDGMGLRVPLI